MSLFSRLGQTIRDKTQNLLQLGKSFVTNIKTAVGNVVNPATGSAAAINALNNSKQNDPYRSIPGVDSRTGQPNMSLQPNMSTMYGPAATIGGKTVVVNPQGQVNTTATLQNSASQAKQQAQLSYGLRPSTSGNIQDMMNQSRMDDFGRLSNRDMGQPYYTATGKLIIPKVAFSGVSGTGGMSTLSTPATGGQGLAGGSASTGLLGASSGLGTPSILGSSQEEPEGVRKAREIARQANQNAQYSPAPFAAFPQPVLPTPETPNIPASFGYDQLSAQATGQNAQNIPMAGGDAQSIGQDIQSTFNDTQFGLDQNQPIPENPVQDTPAQLDFINQSADPFGVQQALDDFREQNTNLADLQRERVDTLKNIQSLNAAYAPILKDIKENPNLPKGLAQRRLLEVNKQQKEVMQGFLDQYELLNQSIDDQNTIVNRAFNIVENAQLQQEKYFNRQRDNFNLMVQSGAVGGFTDKDIAKYSQNLGIDPSAIRSLRDAANNPDVAVEGNAKDGFTQFTYEKKAGKKTGKVTTKQLTKPIVEAGAGTNVVQTLANSGNKTLAWLGQAATNISNAIYSKDQRNNFLGNVNAAINSGNLDEARNQITTFAYNKLNTQAKADYDLYENAKSIARSAVSKIESGTVEFGPYKSFKEFLKPFLGQEKDQNYAQVRQAIELAQAQIRKGYYGTAVTSTEAGNAGQFLITNNDDGATVATKLKGYSNFLDWVNDATIARSLGVQKPDINDYLGKDTTTRGTQNTQAQNLRDKYNY
jgi:hypothetical protein